MTTWRKRLPWLLWLIPLLILGVYLWNLTGWRIFDDEGEYLYQVWRMSQFGEVPYRDFLTPQLPVFLYLGAAVMKLAGPVLWVMRFYTVLLAFGTGGMLFLMGRRHHSVLTGVLAFSIFLLHVDVFRETRIFRNEPLFLFLVTAGLLLGTWSPRQRERWWLAAAGACFGLATMTKLFGLLPFGGVGLWLVVRWWERWRRERQPFREMFYDGLALTLPLLAVLLLLAGGFRLIVPDFFDFVLGHHLDQGSQQTFAEILSQKARLYLEYLSFYPVLVPLTLISAAIGLYRGDARRRWVWQLPAVLAFLFLSRELGRRHFMFALPAIVLLASWLLSELLTWRARWRLLARAGAALAIVAILVPAMQENLYRAGWVDDSTGPIVNLIDAETDPGESVLADDIGLAYYSRRPTTYSGAALSHGAANSGQITGEILIEEIVRDQVRIVIVDESLLTGNHMVFLRDYPRFYRFLEQNYQRRAKIRRDYQELAIWVRPAGSPFVTEDRYEIEYADGTQFGESMELLGYSLPDGTVTPGDMVNFKLFWTSDAPAENYWSIFVHLVAPDGTIVAQGDKVSYDGVYPPDRWWPGQIVDDRFSIQMPADAPAGAYQIAVGMYDWQTGERLLLRTRDGTAIPDNRHIIDQTIEVEH